MQAQISLSILGYEKELEEHMDNITHAKVFNDIQYLVNSGKLYGLHIDVMRPPFIPDKSVFTIRTIKQIYQNFYKKINLELHLMLAEPILFIEGIDYFIQPNNRARISVIIQYEAYNQEDEIIRALRILSDLGYNVGIGFDLQTPFEKLTEKIVENSDLIFLMCVPMGKGGQKYDEQATEKIKYASKNFTGKIVEVDGGINDKTIQFAKNAGAKVFVIGSYITKSEKPSDVVKKIEEILTKDTN